MSARPGFRKTLGTLGLLAAISFPASPESLKKPDPIPISLYVWNASSQSAAISVAIDGTWLFNQAVPAGGGAARHDVVELLPGAHAGECVIGASRHAFTVTVAEGGFRWLIVTWWGQACDVRMQRQPPWVVASSAGRCHAAPCSPTRSAARGTA